MFIITQSCNNTWKYGCWLNGSETDGKDRVVDTLTSLDLKTQLANTTTISNNVVDAYLDF